MSRASSGYERREADLYQTEEWVGDAIAEVIALRGRIIWECAIGPGRFARAMKERGATVIGTDIMDYGCPDQVALFDFTSDDTVPAEVGPFHGIITNPPYGKRNKMAEVFIEKGLERLRSGGFMALLLPVDFDSGKTRRRFFADCRHFAGKIVLTKRINWFAGEESGNGNTENHAIYLWRIDPLGLRQDPRIFYAPRSAA